MPYDPPRPSLPPRTTLDPALRELLTYLRDTFRDAASRIDRYLGESLPRTASIYPRPSIHPGPRPSATMDRVAPRGNVADPGVRYPLEALREEARRISNDAPTMDPATLRLQIEAVTAETRALQNRASDPEDQDIAAKILRALTAIVSEHRPGHVYGLARHHQADWDEVARRARRELAEGVASTSSPAPPDDVDYDHSDDQR